MTIDWQSTVARLDADPDITTSAGQAVLTRLINAGRAYDNAGQPDVLHESEAHQEWANLRPSERLGRTEPPFYVSRYYQRVGADRARSVASTNDFRFKRVLTLADVPEQYRSKLTPSVREAFGFWSAKDPAIARRILLGSVWPLMEAERAEALKKLPTYGAVEAGLVSAVAAAEAFLEAN